MSGDRAVSHMLGFILTFGIILTSIGIVSTVGYDQLNDIRTSEQQNNAERAMQLLHQNVGEIQRGTSVHRSGEIDLNEGRFGVFSGESSRMQVNVTSLSGPTDDYHGEFPLSGARYEVGDTDIVLEGGALFRQDRGGIVLPRAPTLVCTEDRAMVSLVSINTEGSRQVGSGTVTTDVTFNESVVQFPRNRTGVNSSEGNSEVTVRVYSEYDEGWNRYFTSDENGWEPAAGNGNQYVCNGPSGNGVERYTVVQTVVNLSITR